VLLSLIVGCAFAAEAQTRYDGQMVVKAQLENAKQLKLIQTLNLDIWSNEGVAVIGENDIRVTRAHSQILSAHNIQYDVMIADVQALIDFEAAQNANRSRVGDFYSAYSTYPQIVAYVQSLAVKYSTLAVFTPSIGKTFEGRDIPAITFSGSKNSTDKRKIFFSGLQHAREWISPVTVVYIVEQLLAGYTTNAAITHILDRVVFVVVPLVNADGYEFTWSTTRLWRKNRHTPPSGSTAYGVDLNRNWDDHWCEAGASPNPASDTYCGTAPFSEPETTALSKYVLETGPFDANIDFHSYSQLILRPYGWTQTPPPNDATAASVGTKMRSEILSVHGMQYTSQPIWQLYIACGSANDWLYTTAKVPLSYCIELRDTGRYGFVLPPDQIVPTGEENLAAILYLGSYVADL